MNGPEKSKLHDAGGPDTVVSPRLEVIFKKSSNHYAQLDLGVCYQ